MIKLAHINTYLFGRFMLYMFIGIPDSTLQEKQRFSLISYLYYQSFVISIL